MKTKITLLFLLAFFSFNLNVAAQCTTGTLQDSQAYTPHLGYDTQIVGFYTSPGKYNNVVIVPNRIYEFYTGVATDYITITNADGTVILAQGTGSVYWTTQGTGNIRYYMHKNAACGVDTTTRHTYINCFINTSCAAMPSDVLVSNITSNSAHLTWTEPVPSPNNSYDLYISTNATPPVAATIPTQQVINYYYTVLPNLLANTTYYYSMRSNCGSSKSAWTTLKSFTTNAFQSCNGAINGTNLYTFTPPLTATTTVMETRSPGEFERVRVVNNATYRFTTNLTTDYITITDDTGSIVYATGVVPLTWNSGSVNGIVRSYMHSNASCGVTTALGNSTKWVKATPSASSCVYPDLQLATNITSNSARISWTAPTLNAPGSYDVYISTSSVLPTASTVPTTSTTATLFDATGLQPGTKYYYWVRSDCGASKSQWAWETGMNFTTQAAVNCNGATYGLYPTATFVPVRTGNPEQIVADAKAGQFSNVTVVSNTQYTFTSSVSTDYITITNSNGALLASGQGPVVWNSGPSAGTVRFFIHTNNACGEQNVSRVRSVSALTATSCGLPTNFSVSEITSNYARITWTAPAGRPGSYDVYAIASSTFVPSVSTTPSVSSTNTTVMCPYSSSGTTIYYWIRSNCGAVKSEWVSGGSFTKPAYASCNGAKYGLYPEETYTPLYTGTPEVITEQTYAGEYSNINVLPYKNYLFDSSANDNVTITDATGGIIYAYGLTPLSWASENVSGVVRYFIHTDDCSDEAADRARYITATDATTCKGPTALTASNITSNSARLAWTAPAYPPMGGYEVYFSTVNSTPTAATPAIYSNASVTSLAYNLSAATTYYYWVRSNCNGTIKGSWISGGSFTTNAFANCNGANYGLYPETTYTPAGTGLTEVAFESYAGQYSNFNALAGRHYIFSTSVSTDYVTITNAAGTVVYASGLTPLTWLSGSTAGVLRYYVHTNASCGYQNTARTKYITATLVSSCGGTVSGMTVSHLTSNSARISWTAPASAPNGYEMYWSTSNAVPPAPISSYTSSTSANVNDLSSGTTYYYWVRTSCNTTKGPWTMVSFTTLQPLICNGANYGINPEATFTPLETQAPEVVTTTSYAGQYSNINALAKRDYTFTSSVATDFLTITNAAGTTVYASGQTPLSWSSATTSGVVRFYVHSDAACGMSFNPLYRTKSITAVPPQIISTGDIVVVGIGADTGTDTQSADEFSWMPLTNLRAGTQFYITDAGWNTASNQFMCTDNTEDILWRFTVPAGGIPAGTVQTVSQNGTNANYEVILGTQCGSDADGKLTIANSGDQIVFFRSDAPINASFPGTNFSAIYAVTTATANWASLTTNTASIAPGLRDNYSNLPPGLTNGLTALAVGLGSGVQDDADNARYEGPTSGIRQFLLSSVGTLSNWKRYDNGAGSEFPDFNGSNPVFGWTANGLANYAVEYCNPPVAVTKSLGTYHSLRVSWTAPQQAPAGGYQVYYRTTGGVPVNVPIANVTTNTYYDIDGLTPGTYYYIWVRSVCGTNPASGDWMDAGNYTTPQPGCTSGALSPTTTFTPTCDGGNQIIDSATWSGLYSNVNILSNQNYIFSTTRATDFITITNSTGSIVYAYGTTPVTWNSGSNTGVIRYYIHKNDGCGTDTVYMAKMIACQTPGSCALPHYLTATDITSQTVKISWEIPAFTTGGSQVYVSTVNTTPSPGLPTTTNATANNFLTINGLAPATAYYYWVRSVCGANNSAWVYGGTFNTKFSGCTAGSLYPNETFTPIRTGDPELITTIAYAGEYSNVNILSDRHYVFTSSAATDYVSITNANGTQVLAYGVTPLAWDSGFDGTIRFYLHTSFACGTENVNREKSVICNPDVCAAPTGLTVSMITSQAARFTWNEEAFAEIYTSTENTPPSASSEPGTTIYGNSILLYNFAPATTYYYWVRTNCTYNSSVWVPGGSFTTVPTVSPGCNGATHGLYPLATFTPLCSGDQELITASSWPGEYTNVNVISDKQYTFESSVATDYITITNENGSVLLAYGVTPVVWNSGAYSGVIRYHFNLDAACGASNVTRNKFVTCEAPPCLTTSSEDVTACDSYTWNDVAYTASGNYTYQTTNAETGCVNIATLHLTINNSTTTLENVTACDSYEWHGVTYTVSGDYTYESTNASGCTNIATLHLRVNYNTSSEETVTECYTYYWNGQEYNESGDYTFESTNESGCTHTATLHLTIHHSTQSEEPEEVFACDFYDADYWHITETGVYGIETTNEWGCMHMRTISLTIGHSSTSEESATACDSYEWHGEAYTESGDYTYESTNATGCTNTATLHLTINKSTISEQDVTACDAYTWYGETYTETGAYTHESTNASGCIHTETLYLTINSSTTSEEEITACDSYEWHGEMLTESGDYTYESTNDSGCTNIATLHLTINSSTTSEESATACNSYEWHGDTYTETGDYTYESINASGCTHTATLHLTINNSTAITENVTACDSYIWHGEILSETWDYTYESTNASGCAHTETLHLTINHSTTSSETVTACGSYTWHGTTYTDSGDYTHTGTNASGCTDTATLHLTLTHTPAPTASAQSFCSGNVADLTASGTAIRWYATATGGTALTADTALETGTYYATQTIDGCESTRTAVSVTIQVAMPSAPSPQTFVCGARRTSLSAAGTTLRWYTTPTGGTAMGSSDLLTTGTYYVTQTISGCQSSRRAVEVIINNIAAPTATNQTFCYNGTVGQLTATGTDLRWYSAETGGTPLTMTTQLMAGTYYVSQKLGTCESARTAVQVTLSGPALPEATSPQTYNCGARRTSLVATGTGLKWYTTASGGSAILSSAQLVTGSYYVSQTISGCEGPRKEVSVTIIMPTAPTAFTQYFCTATTVASLYASGTNIKWYATDTDTTPLASTTPLVTATYYVSQTNSMMCESTRTAVQVVMGGAPMPEAPSPQTFVCGSKRPSLVATGTSLLWYTAPTGGTALSSTAVLVTGTYYVTQNVSGCVSDRKAVSVIITNPAAPTSSAQTLCSGATVSNLTASGTALKWYTTPSGGSALATGTTLITGTYYVSQTVGSCEGDRTAVSVTINTTPMPDAPSPQIFSCNVKRPSLVATGAGLLWYTVPTGGTALSSTAQLATGTYYVSQTIDGCTSARRAVSVTVNATAPPTTSDQTHCNGTQVSSLTATGTALKWYTAASGGMALASTTTLTAGTYYVSQTVSGCESLRSAANVTLMSCAVKAPEQQTEATPTAEEGITLTYGITVYPNPTSSVLNIKANGGLIIESVIIIDSAGRVVLEQSNNVTQVDVARFARGVYILRAYSTGKEFQAKFVKE